MTVSSVSIVICTYNRAALLRETLASLQTLEPPDDCAVEIIVVDNNSTDDTPAVIAEAARDARPFPIVALHEQRQGKSFALNTALALAQGDILALADDDVLPASGWLRRIVDNFRARDVTFVFGKVLPRWERTPPAALLTRRAQDIWGPLALVDYGDEPTEYPADNSGQRLPIGANLSFARDAIRRIGGWRTDLGKVNNTLISGEDHEIFERLRRAGSYAGYYDPQATVLHFVPASRVTRRYFRRWFYWHGKTQALMLDELYPELDMANTPRVAGIPRFACRQGLQQIGRWLRSGLGRDHLEMFINELRVLQFAGFCVECVRRSRSPRAARSEPLPLSSPTPLGARIVKTR
jgi:glycosyltransferase involved in cell wall biosynthesis